MVDPGNRKVMNEFLKIRGRGNMPDIATIASALSSIKTAVDIAKLIKESSVSLEQAEVKLKLAELISALADAKIEIANVQEALVGKDRQIAELRELQNIRERLKYEAPYYWMDRDGTKDGPYCQQCWDNSQKLIRLQGSTDGYWHCRTCDSGYTDQNHSGSGGGVGYYDNY
ncbi:MAG: hypothetical protein P4L55_03335 [Syntrophobacteraceae bacterium]|nr:hypothetical protein [Syntrophobacteraceae bacterium]